MRDLFSKLMTGSMVAGAALLVAACGGSETANTADANMTDMNTMEADMGTMNDVTAVDGAMAGDNMSMDNSGMAADNAGMAMDNGSTGADAMGNTATGNAM